MPICPSCQYEYQEGIESCSDCGVKLVDHLPSNIYQEMNEEFVPLPTLPGRVYAEMVKEALEQAGIPCMIKTDVLSSSLLTAANAPGNESRIFVKKRHQKKAQEILHTMMDHI
jgi:hypothetical protein